LTDYHCVNYNRAKQLLYINGNVVKNRKIVPRCGIIFSKNVCVRITLETRPGQGGGGEKSNILIKNKMNKKTKQKY